MIAIAISTTIVGGGEYAQAVAAAGGEPRLPPFDADAVESELDRCAGVLLSGGGDVDPRHYGGVGELADDVEPSRDTFEFALVRRARERGIPTLCICRGLQVANVAFGGALIEDIATAFDPPVAERHRRMTDGTSERGLIAGHDVAIEPDSLLARIVGRTAIVTGSRHHQSIRRPAADLRVVAHTPDRIVEAAEARFASPFWLGVQWHPESTVTLDGGVSRAIFAAFIDAARRFAAERADAHPRFVLGTRSARMFAMEHAATNPRATAPVILHLGIGSFHRAHQAWYLHRLIEGGLTDWSLAAATIRPDMVPLLDALARQDGTYTLETVTPEGVRAYERIRSIKRVVPWDADLAAVIDVGAEARTRIISFTVTEGGYYLDDHHHLDVANPDLAADLGGARRTIYGTVAAILRARLERGSGAVTLLNCDNLRSNGERFRSGLLEFLERRGDDAVRRFVLDHTTCPSSMVDRITPRPLPDVAERVRAATGFDDACPVMAESFIQWVIEDEFCAGRPPWERAGAELVTSVLPYEEAKIRILNASHSCIAWAGTLVGMRYIHEGTHDPAIRTMAYDYITSDVIPCLTPSPLDLAQYRDVVLERFGNPYVLDTNARVTADGFSKIPGFIAPTLRELLARDAPLAATAMLPALYFVFLERWHRGELPYAYQDGVMDPIAAHAMLDAPDPLAAFCAERQLWGTLAANAELEAAIRAGVERVEAWLATRAG